MEMSNVDILSIQRAIDLAEYYKDNILVAYSAVDYVYRNSGIDEILKKIKPSEMFRFSEKEIKSILSEKELAELKSISKTDDFIKSIIEANEIYSLNIKRKNCTIILLTNILNCHIIQ